MFLFSQVLKSPDTSVVQQNSVLLWRPKYHHVQRLWWSEGERDVFDEV